MRGEKEEEEGKGESEGRGGGEKEGRVGEVEGLEKEKEWL